MKLPRSIPTLVVFAAFVGLIAYIVQQDGAKNVDARAAGFADLHDQDRAKSAGFSDASAWRTKTEKDKREKDETAAAVADIRRELDRNPATKMKLSGFQWSAGGFGRIGIISATVENGNNFAVKDIGLQCSFSGNSGTQLGSVAHVIFDIVRANSKKQFKDVNVGLIHGQSTKAYCAIETAKRL